MTREELVQLLKTDVKAFNAYREANPDLRPDLEATDLRGLNLSGSDLRKSNLSGANLEGADLRKARLQQANLTNVNLRNADLRECSLHAAVMDGCDLSGAHLGFASATTRICLHPDNFNDVRFDRQQVETFLEILKGNSDWEIEYTLKPKNPGQGA